jgi:phosphopantetheinyl transferase
MSLVESSKLKAEGSKLIAEINRYSLIFSLLHKHRKQCQQLRAKKGHHLWVYQVAVAGFVAALAALLDVFSSQKQRHLQTA